MPTYYACGVTATLATCDLESSLSYTTSFRQGAELKQDAARMRGLFSAADKLCERPIGADGSEKGILQFIGVDEDMPLYVVEARPEFDRKHEDMEDVQMQDAPASPPVDSANENHVSSEGSPLTSLGATPSPVTPSFMNSPRKNRSYMQLTADALASLEDGSGLKDKTDPIRNMNNRSPVQALALDVHMSDKSFLPEDISNDRKTQTTSKDLKIEVFLNGELVEVALVHGADGKRKTTQPSKEHIRFSGTRVHRQVEKPWMYSKEVTSRTSADGNDGERRWNAISAAYTQEAANRGRDKTRYPPPSASFLLALADMKLPERVKDHPQLAVVDLVITAGKGRKYGPETIYLTKPTRLDDPNYSKVDVSEDQHSSPVANSNSNQASTAPISISPAPRRVFDLKKELNLDVDPSKLFVQPYENARGAKGKSGRTLQQRLGDLKKMNSANLERELANLKDEFADKGPSPKKRKLEDTTAQTDVFMSSPKPSIQKIEPTKLVMKPPPVLPHSVDPEAVLTQSRIDVALQQGAASNGPLLRRIASTSPQRTPKKSTNVSALAGSPTSTPVKTPRRASRTPRGTEVGAEDQAILAPDKAESSPSRPPKAGKASTPKAKTAEQQVAEALDAFRIPEGCRGSCVSYEEDVKVSRQIGKIRGGEFKEETLLVGMRFVVL